MHIFDAIPGNIIGKLKVLKKKGYHMSNQHSPTTLFITEGLTKKDLVFFPKNLKNCGHNIPHNPPYKPYSSPSTGGLESSLDFFKKTGDITLSLCQYKSFKREILFKEHWKMRNMIFCLLVVCGMQGVCVSLFAQTPEPTVTPIVDCSCLASGKVTNAITGEGIAGAVVVGGDASYASGDGSYTWASNEFPCDGGEIHILTASAENYITQIKTAYTEPCVEQTLNFSLIPSSAPLSIQTFAGDRETSEFPYPKRDDVLGIVITVTVKINGERSVDDGILVTATVRKAGKRYISIINPYALTTNGGTSFAITSKGLSGKARVVLKAGNTKKVVTILVE